MRFKKGDKVSLKEEMKPYVNQEIRNLLTLDYITVDRIKAENNTFTYEECEEIGKEVYVSEGAFKMYTPMLDPWGTMGEVQQSAFLKAILEALYTEDAMTNKIASLIKYTNK